MKQIGIYVLHNAAFLGVGWVIAVARRDKWPDRRIWMVAILASGVIAACLFAVSDPRQMFADFRGSYYRAAVVLESPAALAAILGPKIHGFVNLPVLAYIFAPLGTIPLVWSILLFTALGAAATLWCWRLLVGAARLDTPSAALLMFFFAANGPLIHNFREGNTSHFALLFIVLGFIAQRRRRFFASGALLGIAALIKLPLLLFGVYFALRRRWDAVAGGAAVCVAAAALSLAVFGWDLHVRWYEECIQQYAGQPLSAFNVQSIAAFQARWERGAAGLYDWTPSALSPSGRWIVLLVLAGLFGVTLWTASARDGTTHVAGGDPSKLDLEFMLVPILAGLSSPVTWSHYYSWLLLPMAFMVRRDGILHERSPARVLAWIACMFASLPVLLQQVWEAAVLKEIFARTGASLHLLAALLFLALLLWRLGWGPRPKESVDSQTMRTAF
jgi:hypothetical protein